MYWPYRNTAVKSKFLAALHFFCIIVTIPCTICKILDLGNRPIHFKAQGMWGTCGDTSGVYSFYVPRPFSIHFYDHVQDCHQVSWVWVGVGFGLWLGVGGLGHPRTFDGNPGHPSISMKIMLNFDPCTRCLEVGYTDNMNISQKFALSSTRGKLSRLPKVTLRGAIGHQRQQCLMHFFRHFSNDQEKMAVFCYGYQTRSMAEAQKSPLHVCFFDI